MIFDFFSYPFPYFVMESIFGKEDRMFVVYLLFAVS